MRNGSKGFRLRCECAKQGLRIERDDAPRGIINAPFDLDYEGVPQSLAIGRIDNDRFGFWVKLKDESAWRFVGESDHASIPTDTPLSVGIEAYSRDPNRSFVFDNLRREPIPDKVLGALPEH